MEKADFLLKSALNCDEKRQYLEAQNLYTQAVEFCIRCVSV